jgi:hypothetical protein
VADAHEDGDAAVVEDAQTPLPEGLDCGPVGVCCSDFFSD